MEFPREWPGKLSILARAYTQSRPGSEVPWPTCAHEGTDFRIRRLVSPSRRRRYTTGGPFPRREMLSRDGAPVFLLHATLPRNFGSIFDEKLNRNRYERESERNTFLVVRYLRTYVYEYVACSLEFLGILGGSWKFYFPKGICYITLRRIAGMW